MTDDEYDKLHRLLVRFDRLFGRMENGWPRRRDPWDEVADKWVLSAWDGNPPRMTMTTIPGDWWDCERLARNYRTRSESARHLAAKHLSCLWLRSIGATDAVKECSCFVGRADVYSKMQRIVLEVGHTTRGKAMHCAATGYRFIIVPFRRWWERPKAIEIHFTDESRLLATELFRAERRAGMCRIMENAGDE